MRKTLLYLLFLALFLHGADINDSLVRGTTQTYESLLATLKKTEQKNDDTALQEALLYKLINLSKNPPVEKIVIERPDNEKAYRELIVRFGNWALSKAEAAKDIASLEERLGVVADQLKSSESNASNLLTLQLQYAFYTKGKNLYIRKLEHYKEAIGQAPSYFVEGLQRISFDTDTVKKRIGQIDTSLEKLEKEIQRLDVERERLNLLGKSGAVKRIGSRIDRLQAKKRNLLNEKLVELFILFSSALHDKKSTEAFALQKRIMKIIERSYPEEVQDDMRALFDKMETTVLGRAETIKGATLEEIKNAVSLFWEKANAPLFVINETPISAFKLFMALFIFVIGIVIGGFYKNSIKRLTFKTRTLTSSTRTLLANLGYYTIIIIAFFIALNVVGINLSSIALVAGALSVGIGFGLQNIVSNFVSGIILMFERSIKIGDYIEFDENLRGHVSDIRMRSTTITTNDNIDVIVPNQDLIQNRVINWTMNDQIRRFRIPFGVAYGTDVHKVVGVIKDAVKKSGFGDIYNDGQRHTRVIMTGMNDSSVDFQLFVWIRGGEILYPRRTESRFLILIYDALYEAGIEIPFPQRDIHIRSVDEKIPLRLDREDDDNAPRYDDIQKGESL
ncbi:mechanosensitive ion channel family protein [Hydrogenimonas cancrithermarum]|uniref:Mechanosensitive ion channel MscS domain-containing protein n=1 Tax=Hydrogenimonas cancrithermarum TaxID=2993563 RepID=A0ABM8FHK5_9BACT|nr:mechanosensitive ion channel domain-containing protein [Hydrogenimonas cancrithermarum]BDY11771.1 hypothetical protein HCR_00830 [Hydrogenimonas cancrithermarum]